MEEEIKEEVKEEEKPEIVKQTDAANAAADRMEKATAELNKAEAKARLGGVTTGGKEENKPKEETDKEYRTRINKELAEGKTEFGT